MELDLFVLFQSESVFKRLLKQFRASIKMGDSKIENNNTICTHHVGSESEHQRERVPQGIHGADNRGTPRLMHFPAPRDPTDGELGNKYTYPSEALRDVAI